MKKYLVTLAILALAVSAWATFPGSPIGGGTTLTTGSVTSDYILDNSIVNADVNDNAAISPSKLLGGTLDNVAAIQRSINIYWATGSGEVGDSFSIPKGIAVDASGTYIYIADDMNNRIVKINAANFSFSAKIGALGTGNDQFNEPSSVALDNNGFLYVGDGCNNRLFKRLASDLSYVAQVGTLGVGDNNFNNMGLGGIATDNTYLYIADINNNRIVKRLCSDLSYVGQVGSQGAGNNQFLHPNGVTTDGTYLWIVDTGNNRVVKRLCSDLSYVSQVSLWNGSDAFSSPTGITISSEAAFLLVADTSNHRILKFTPDFVYVGEYGFPGSGQGALNEPTGLSLTSDDAYLYVANTLNNRIERIAPVLPNDFNLRKAKAVSIQDNLIMNEHVNSAAGIDVTKIGGGLVDNTELSYLDNVTSPIKTQLDGKQTTITANDNLTVDTLTARVVVNSGADNTHSGNVKNTSSPTGPDLAAGNYWTLPDETMRLRNQDNTATNILASAYQYRNFAFDNSAMDNMVLIQNLPFTEVWDNVIYTVRGYADGKPSGASTDNVTTNFYCCTATDNTLAQCTKIFTNDQVPTGAATLAPAINNGTCNAGSEIRISFSAINLSARKLNIRTRHLRR